MRKNGEKKPKHTKYFINPDYYNKSNNVESKTLAIIICVTDFALLIAFYGLLLFTVVRERTAEAVLPS